jgi:uncharacterized membrane protein
VAPLLIALFCFRLAVYKSNGLGQTRDNFRQNVNAKRRQSRWETVSKKRDIDIADGRILGGIINSLFFESLLFVTISLGWFNLGSLNPFLLVVFVT